MEMKDALRAFRSQKSNAKKRGISFMLTFKEWCDFWGEDIDRRGSGHDQLQMQRYGDLGGYEIGNIKKGYPRQNTKTSGCGKRNKKAEVLAKELQDKLDAAMQDADNQELDELKDYEIHKLGFHSSSAHRYRFKS